jgi:hypothetical protein
VGAYINLGSFYLLGIPMAMLLGFVLNMGAKGLWIGVVCGSISQTTLLSAVTFFTDWQKMVCSSSPSDLNPLAKQTVRCSDDSWEGLWVPHGSLCCIFVQADKARERSLSEKAMESESRYLLE